MTKNANEKMGRNVSEEFFKKYQNVTVYNHKEIGPAIARAVIIKAFPASADALKKAVTKKANQNATVSVAYDEAIKANIQTGGGNPKLGVRLVNESCCWSAISDIDKDKRNEYLDIIYCIFHKEELQAKFDAEKKPVEEKSSEVVKERVEIKPEININMSDVIETLQMNNLLMQDQVDATKQIAEKVECLGKAILLLTDVLGQLIHQNTEVVTTPTVQVTENVQIPENGCNKFYELQNQMTAGNPIRLTLKRERKMPVYRKENKELQSFKDELLKGVPKWEHNATLSHAYTRMKNIYGVPIDTYKNEYYADTGKVATNSLEIAHWLEFRNPVIKGLLRCCVEAVVSESKAKADGNEKTVTTTH